MANEQQYYSNPSEYGDYQYIKLCDVVNNFMLNYAGEDSYVHDVPRYKVLYHAKRGLQEFNYDILKEIKTLELEIGDNLQMVLPQDYVNYTRISTVSESGELRPLTVNTKSTIAKAYLQDHNYEILFDNNGCALEGDSVIDRNRMKSGDKFLNENGDQCSYYSFGGRYGMDTANANSNSSFLINKRKGIISFSSDVESQAVVLEYISDGLEYEDDSDIMVHKFAEKALYYYIRMMIIENKDFVQEYVVRRYKKAFYNALRVSKSRLNTIRHHEIANVLRGQSKWIKH